MVQIDETVKEFISGVAEDLDSPIWKDNDPVPSGFQLRVHSILSFNDAWKRYVYNHRSEITGFQLESVLKMLDCSRRVLGGMMMYCGKCNKYTFIPFSCHGRVCVRCGKLYAKTWGNELRARFSKSILVM